MKYSNHKHAALFVPIFYHSSSYCLTDPKSMPAIYQRLRNSIRRRPHHLLQGDAAIFLPKRREQQQDTDPSDDEDEGEVQEDGRNSSPLLPVIKDSGPPTSNRYANPDIFWNSTMIEADNKDKTWLPPLRPGKLRPEDEYTGRSRLPKYGFTRDTPSTQSKNLHKHNSIPPTTRAAAAQQRRDAMHRSRNFERNISYGRERADNDLNVMYYSALDHPQQSSDVTQQQRSPSPRMANTWERDNFPDVPSENLSPIHLEKPEQPNASQADHISTLHPLIVFQEESQSPNLCSAYHVRDPSSSPVSLTCPTALTWNAALNRILHNDAVDPDLKQRVRERIKSSKTRNGDGEGEYLYVAAPEAGLVPNFSYPVAASVFYDRNVAAASPVPSASAGGNDKQERKIATTTPQSQNFDFGFNFADDVSSPSLTSFRTYASTSSLFWDKTTSPTSLLPSRRPSVNTDVHNRLNALLAETLNQSELTLLNAILATTSNTATSSPILLRLIHNLYILLTHLQDRALHLEDTLLPQLGAILEHKTLAIDVLSVGIQNFGDQITQLKTTVDFGNKILAGCWMREYEMWRTLTSIREARRRAWWNVRRSRVAQGVLSPDAGQRFLGRELDAIVLMAEQNVGILREDVEDMVDMVEKVEACQRAFVAFPAVEKEDGSWRDV